MWNMYGLQLAPRSASELQPVLMNTVLVRLRDLGDREARGGRDLADDHRDLVALDQALGLGRGGLRIDRILHHELDLAAHDAARGVDLLGRELDAHHGVFAERPEEAGARRQMADPDGVGLRASTIAGMPMPASAAEPAAPLKRVRRVTSVDVIGCFLPVGPA